MLTKTIQISFSIYAAETIRIHTGETGREIIFAPDMEITGDYNADFIVVKPDDTFVIAAATIADGKINVEIPEQAGAVAGAGHYILKIYDSGEVCIYSASGGFMVDDHLLTDGIIESVAEVYGYNFPQDFALKSETATLNDNVTALNSTWSSQKISDEIATASHDIIDDNEVLYDKTWSSEKINDKTSITKSATGNPVEFSDGAGAPLVKCVTQITGYQQGSGTPSPDNIRPIVAYTEGEIEVRGKNMCDKTEFNHTSTLTYKPMFVGDGTFTMSTNCPPTGGGQESYRDIFFLPGNVNSGASSFINGVIDSTPITCESIGGYVTVASRYNAVRNDPLNYNWQIEKGSVPTPYEPYVCTTHTTTYTSAIYRGSEDVVNGTATTEWGMIASYAGETLPGEWISDRDEYAPGTTPTTGAQVAYALATPTTSPVTPTNLPIRTISGYNHIESSTGDMEIEYMKGNFQPIINIIPEGAVSYSTAEHKIGTWCDGTDLYEITIEDSGISASAAVQLTIPMNINIKEMFGIGRIFLSNRFYYMPIGCVSGAGIGWNGIKIDAEPKYSRLTVNLNAPSGSAQTYIQVTIRYTKPLS